MKLTVKTEYACLAMIDLAENYSPEYIKINDICKRKNIPRKFLENILLSLKTAGYCHSRRGGLGGYRLSRDPAKITIAEIIRLMDGALAPVESVSIFFYRQTPIESSHKMKNILRDIRDYIAHKLENTTFADLI